MLELTMVADVVPGELATSEPAPPGRPNVQSVQPETRLRLVESARDADVLGVARSDPVKPPDKIPTTVAAAEKRLDEFISKFDEKNQAVIRATRKTLRRRLPAATELVYDNYNFFVIGYCSTARPSDCVVSIAAGANGVSLSFSRGATLPDPQKVLLGKGTQNRFIRLESAATLVRAEVETLIAAAVSQARTPLPATGRGKLIIRSVSGKQRPRRKPTT
jgi:Domain of unknown function (DU1801)